MKNSIKNNVVNLLTRKFLDNRRMQQFFDVRSSNYERKMYNLISYCYKKACRADGVYYNDAHSFAALYYEKKMLRFGLKDLIDSILLIWQIGLQSALNIHKVQKEATKLRQQYDNYIYVWFMAQDSNQLGLQELIRFNRYIEQLATEKNLPILIETTDENLLNLYQRAGFRIYNFCEKSSIFYLMKTNFTISQTIFYRKSA